MKSFLRASTRQRWLRQCARPKTWKALIGRPEDSMVVPNATPLIALDAVVIDTETTGLHPADARIVEGGAVRIQGGRILDGAYSHLVHPGIPIPKTSTAIHHIDDSKVAGAPTFAEIWPELRKLIGGSIVIGHTIGFDLAVLKRECQRAGHQFEQLRVLAPRLTPVSAPPPP